MFLAQFQGLEQVEALHQDLRGSSGEKSARQDDAIDVVHGQEDQHDFGRGDLEGSSELEMIGSQVMMADHGALGEARGAGGVRQRHQVTAADLDVRRVFGRGFPE